MPMDYFTIRAFLAAPLNQVPGAGLTIFALGPGGLQAVGVFHRREGHQVIVYSFIRWLNWRGVGTWRVITCPVTGS